jgi:lysophospholipase L1-like esterase
MATGLPVAALVALEVGLRAADVVPPDDPLLFHARSHAVDFGPFVEAESGALEIRPDWVNDGDGLRGRRGRRAGRQFLYPGFRPTRIASPKPDGRIRVLALGGSTTFGLYVGAEAAFPASLERRLSARAGGRDVEVVNLGCAGFASDRVLALLRSALALEPDLVVVYTGHNEMLGGPATEGGALGPAQRLRARLLEVSTVFAWLNHALATTLRAARTEALREDVAALEAGEIPTFVPEAVPPWERRPPSEAFRRRAAARLSANVSRMIEASRAAGVPIVFAIPAANLLSPPALSTHPEGFAAEREFAAALRATRQARETGDLPGALRGLDRALKLSPRHAMTHFRRGRLLAELGRVDEARAAYRRAVDLDARTHRITTPLEEALIAALEAAGAQSVDLRADFQDSLDPAQGERLFVDHLHPTAEGHELVAERLLAPLSATLGLDADAAQPPRGR